MKDLFDIEDAGFDDFSKLLKEFEKKTSDENIIAVLETGAKALVDDLLKLPKPKSKISKAGYTHLIDSFAYQRNGKEIEVAWGKYYGPMVEHGTQSSKGHKGMKAQPHVKTTFEQNNNKYYSLMINKILN